MYFMNTPRILLNMDYQMRNILAVEIRLFMNGHPAPTRERNAKLRIRVLLSMYKSSSGGNSVRESPPVWTWHHENKPGVLSLAGSLGSAKLTTRFITLMVQVGVRNGEVLGMSLTTIGDIQ